MSIELAGAAAVVTGAGSGIGRAAAISLSARGTKVLVTDLQMDRALTVAEQINASGGVATALMCDVAQMDHLERARDTCLERFGRVDVVMNNVGVIAMGPPEAIPLEEWERVLDIDVLGIVRSNLVFLPILIEQGRGHVINTASTAGLLAHSYDRLPYVAAKHAVVGMSEALAIYLKPRGIGVTCLCPAGVFTNIVEQIRFFGTSTAPRALEYPMVTADVVGELVADAIAQDRFLVLTAPDVHDDVVERARDPDAYIAKIIARSSSIEDDC